MALIISIFIWLFGTFNVSSQCFNSNAECRIIYNDGECMFYVDVEDTYYELSDLANGIWSFIYGTLDVPSVCTAYWEDLYSSKDSSEIASLCADSNSYIWPIGSCGCPRCECPSGSFCCYESIYPFHINDFNDNAAQRECSDSQDMCFYSVDAQGTTNVSCSDKDFLFNYLSINVELEESVILEENDNLACYTFIEAINGSIETKLQCFCGDNGCNDLSSVATPDLKPKNGCFVSDSFHTELFWIDYVYEDISCEMCSISLYQTHDNALKSDMKCNSRSNCYSLLTQYDAYNDELYGCVSISNISTECCCDPSIHGHLCNKQFFETQNPQNAVIFDCWRADFVDVTDDEWDDTAQRVNCSTEFNQYCVIQSFGANKYSASCETEQNCNNTKNDKRMCCDGIDDAFCNEPSIFEDSVFGKQDYFYAIIWSFLVFFASNFIF